MIIAVYVILVGFFALGVAGIITQSSERKNKVQSENWLTAQREMAAAQRGIVRDATKHERDRDDL